MTLEDPHTLGIGRQITGKCPSGTSYLPPEIIGMISAYMQNEDLKRIRLTCKQFDEVASLKLFNHIYISPHAIDLEVLKKLANQRYLRASVKKLIFDISHFSRMIRWEYVAGVCSKIRRWVLHNRPAIKRNEFPWGIRRLTNEIEEIGDWTECTVSKYINHGWAKEGHASWQRLADEQELWYGESLLLSLTECLSLLPNLSYVEFNDKFWQRAQWDNEDSVRTAQPDQPLKLNDTGSPQCRKWRMYYPQPKRNLDCTQHVLMGLKALCGAQRRIHVLTLNSGSRRALPPTMFKELQIREGLGQKVAIMLCQLRNLDLSITPSETNRAQDRLNLNALAFLPRLLSQLNGLDRLFLMLDTAEDVEEGRSYSDPDRSQSRPYYTYRQIFPTDMRWKSLTMLHVSGLAIRGMDLFYLVFNQAPCLQQLWLNRIELLDSKWEGLVELFFKSRRDWDILSFQGLFQHSNGKWWPFDLPTEDNEQDEWEFLREITRYIMYGGRHPSLPEHASDSESVSYLTELYESVDLEQTRKEITLRTQHWR